MKPLRTAAATITVATLVLSAAACASPGRNGAARLTSTTQALTYAQCMRSHGVANFPNPQPSSTAKLPRLTPQQLGVSDSQYQAAASTCKHLLSNGSDGSGGTPDPAKVQQKVDQAKAKHNMAPTKVKQK
jgi:hypothetical protein